MKKTIFIFLSVIVVTSLSAIDESEFKDHNLIGGIGNVVIANEPQFRPIIEEVEKEEVELVSAVTNCDKAEFILNPMALVNGVMNEVKQTIIEKLMNSSAASSLTSALGEASSLIGEANSLVDSVTSSLDALENVSIDLSGVAQIPDFNPEAITSTFLGSLFTGICLAQNPQVAVEAANAAAGCFKDTTLGQINMTSDFGGSIGTGLPHPSVQGGIKGNMDFTSMTSSASCMMDVQQKYSTCFTEGAGSKSESCTFMQCYRELEQQFSKLLVIKMQKAPKKSAGLANLQREQCDMKKASQKGVNGITDLTGGARESAFNKMNAIIGNVNDVLNEDEDELNAISDCGEGRISSEPGLFITNLNTSGWNVDDEKILQTFQTQFKVKDIFSTLGADISYYTAVAKLQFYRWMLGFEQSNDYLLSEFEIDYDSIEAEVNNYPVNNLMSYTSGKGDKTLLMAIPPMDGMTARNKMLLSQKFCNKLENFFPSLKTGKQFFFEWYHNIDINNYLKDGTKMNTYLKEFFPGEVLSGLKTYNYESAMLNNEYSWDVYKFLVQKACPDVTFVLDKMLEKDRVAKEIVGVKKAAFIAQVQQDALDNGDDNSEHLSKTPVYIKHMQSLNEEWGETSNYLNTVVNDSSKWNSK